MKPAEIVEAVRGLQSERDRLIELLTAVTEAGLEASTDGKYVTVRIPSETYTELRSIS